MTDADRFANTGQHLYLCLSNRYYRRATGADWVAIEEADLPAGVNWSPLHEKQ